MSLTQRTAGVFNAAGKVFLGVTGCRRAPLTKILQFVKGEIANQGQLGVEHRRHMAGVQEEAVTTAPLRVSGVVGEELRIEHVDKVGSTECATRVSGLGFFYHGGRQHANVVGCTMHQLNRVFHFVSFVC